MNRRWPRAAHAPAAAMAAVERLSLAALAPLRQALPFELARDPLAGLARPQADIESALRAVLDRPRAAAATVPMRTARAAFPAPAPLRSRAPTLSGAAPPAPARTAAFGPPAPERSPAFAPPVGPVPSPARVDATVAALVRDAGVAAAATVPAATAVDRAATGPHTAARNRRTTPSVWHGDLEPAPAAWPTRVRRQGPAAHPPIPNDAGLTPFARRAGIGSEAVERPIAIALPPQLAGEAPPQAAYGSRPHAVPPGTAAPAAAAQRPAVPEPADMAETRPAAPIRGSGLERLVAIWHGTPPTAGEAPTRPSRPAVPDYRTVADERLPAPTFDEETLAEAIERLVVREARRHGIRTDGS